MRVVVTVCTRERPQMLKATLGSIITQELPHGLGLSVVVVENDDLPRSAEMVDRLSKNADIPIIYAHEPQLGIPIARNRALSIALQQRPDWIAFIDDDEIASPTWLARFHEAAASVDSDVYQGPVEYVYPSPAPAWMKSARRRHLATGTALPTAATSNTFMRARIASQDGLGLRFNEKMRFTGGSDNDYFYRAVERGARICWLNEALVHEMVPQIRMTLRWQLARSMRVASNTVSMHMDRLGSVRAATKCVPKYVGRGLGALVLLPLAAAASAAAIPRGKRLLASSLSDLASAIGGLGAFFGLRPQPYRVVDRNNWGWDTIFGSAHYGTSKQATTRLGKLENFGEP